MWLFWILDALEALVVMWLGPSYERAFVEQGVVGVVVVPLLLLLLLRACAPAAAAAAALDLGPLWTAAVLCGTLLLELVIVQCASGGCVVVSNE